MFGFSHLPFSSTFTATYNGLEETFVLYIDQGIGFDLFIEEEINLQLLLNKSPPMILS